LPEARLTVSPEGPAAALRVTVPVLEVPPLTVLGLKDTARLVAGVMVREALLAELDRVAVMEAVVLAATPIVLTVKVALLEFAGTVTVDGTVAVVDDELRVTVVAVVGAGVMVTVPVEDVPPGTDVGLRETATVEDEVEAATI
jgi:hypothetical protein